MKLKYRVIERFRGKYPIDAMCRAFEVSRSGYYAWRIRIGKEDKAAWLEALITECQQLCGQTYGIGRVMLWLKRAHDVYANRKAVLRIMRKLDLLSQVRRRKSYTHYKQAVYKYPNLLKRAFTQSTPNQFWVTDITYIPTPNGMLYLCAVMDLCGRKVLAWRLGNDITASLVTDTIRDAMQREKVTDGLTLHSDQGSQYTSTAYHDLSKEYHFAPSMSSPGCPYDNAAMENFFGTLKTECLYRAHYSTRAEVEQLVAEYIQFYNFERINLKDGLTPHEIRSKAA